MLATSLIIAMLGDHSVTPSPATVSSYESGSYADHLCGLLETSSMVDGRGVLL
jgi:hypothetical protein